MIIVSVLAVIAIGVFVTFMENIHSSSSTSSTSSTKSEAAISTTTIANSPNKNTATNRDATQSIVDIFDGEFLSVVGHEDMNSKPATQYQVEVQRGRNPADPSVGTADGVIIVSVSTPTQNSIFPRGKTGILFTSYDSTHKWYELDNFRDEIYD